MSARRNVSRLLPLIILIIITLCPLQIFGQDNLLLYTTKVTLDVKNLTIREILTQIEKKQNITFSYKSGLINENRRKNFTVTNYPLYNTLDSLFKSDSLEYYPLGRQVVIYQPTTSAKTKKIVVRDTLIQNVLRKDTVQVRVLKRDTVIVWKTDTLFDTLLVEVPVPVIDTLFFDKPKMRLQGYLNYNAITTKNSYETNGWKYPGQLHEEGESSGYDYRAGILAQVNLNRSLFFKSGIGFGKRFWHANYDFTTIVTDSARITDFNISVETEVYKSDSISIYFPGSDTIWFYDYDTIFHFSTNPEYKKDTSRYVFNGRNEVSFITIPLYFGWETNLSPKSKLFAEVGLLIDFIISKKGHSLSDYSFGKLVPLNELPFSPVSGYFSLGAGFESSLVKNTSWFVKLNLNYQLNSEFANQYPLRQRKNNVGITLGLTF